MMRKVRMKVYSASTAQEPYGHHIGGIEDHGPKRIAAFDLDGELVGLFADRRQARLAVEEL